MPGERFDYSGIPIGFYDSVLHGRNRIRRLWHLSKFERVLSTLPAGDHLSILDIGCFAGSFLSMIPESWFGRQLGVDILRSQIEYARVHYGTGFRQFLHIGRIAELADVDETFDCITLIEVIEHLDRSEAAALLREISRMLKPGGKLVLTTPNYASAWPLIELLLNRLSDVKYEEQHITKFRYYSIERELARIYPALSREFRVELKTTTHFVTPFLAGLSFHLAYRLSRLVPHSRWRLPFGSLVLLVASRAESVQAGAAMGPSRADDTLRLQHEITRS